MSARGATTMEQTGNPVREGTALDHWRNRNRLYHDRKIEYLRFAIPECESVLLVGCDDGELLAKLKPSRGCGITGSSWLSDCAASRHPRFAYHDVWNARVEEAGPFEYVVIN